jgi:hypothetical protein
MVLLNHWLVGAGLVGCTEELQWERMLVLLILRGATQIYYQLSLIAEIITVNCYQHKKIKTKQK